MDAFYETEFVSVTENQSEIGKRAPAGINRVLLVERIPYDLL
jgi:hypothetical protein